MVSPVSAGGGFTRTGICTIVDMRSLEIEVDVNESYINRVKPGQPGVTAVLDAYPDWQIPAQVITLVPTADRQKATVLVRIGFKALDPRILPDMGVKVTFLREAGDTGAPAARGRSPLVPKRAVRRGETAQHRVRGPRRPSSSGARQPAAPTAIASKWLAGLSRASGSVASGRAWRQGHGEMRGSRQSESARSPRTAQVFTEKTACASSHTDERSDESRRRARSRSATSTSTSRAAASASTCSRA